VIDALGRPQSILVLGATSEIAGAVLDELVPGRVERLVLAGRDLKAVEAVGARFRSETVAVETVAFEAEARATHQAVVDESFRRGDIDLVVVAFGILGDQDADRLDPAGAARVADINYAAAVSTGVALASCLRRQGHGTIVALSSVAAERPRLSNYIYGSAKAGMDAFFRGLAADLAPDGIRVMVVRPGFVKTRMTAELPPAPLATTPRAVATAVARALADGRAQVWVPGSLRWVMAGLRHLPESLFRRLPL
jgi:decaprenylphospho-beta-D-erythro-pentofuranosid-2-ulose 2-reductase